MSRTDCCRLRLSLGTLFCALALVACSSNFEPPASSGNQNADVTVLHNALIYTVDANRSWAEAIAYDRDGNIVAVGNEDDVFEQTGEDIRLVDGNGQLVLPGFVDTHVHVPEAGINEGLCFLAPDESLETYAELLAECIEQQPDSDWVRAAGASLFNLRGADELPIDVLDELLPDRPALILDDLGHAAWTNSKGLAAAGIESDAENPQGGVFLRDPDSGKMTGLLLEDAQQLVRNVASADDETNYDGLLVALETLAANGVTSISDAGGYWAQNHPDAWYRALSEDALTVRAVNSLYVYPHREMAEQLAAFKRLYRNDPDSLLQFNTAKVYVDGILDLGTAALIEPYEVPVDPDSPFGFEYFQPEVLEGYVSALTTMGYRMHFHAVGDRAVRLALDSVQATSSDPKIVAKRRHRTTHTYLVHPDDLPRFKALGVVADFQAGPVSTDVAYHEDLSASIGKRAFDLINVDDMLASGARVSLSSDWDADPLSPFGIIQRALLRESHAVKDVATAIELVTRNAAYALGIDGVTGSLEVGKQADFVVVDQNILEVEPRAIEDTQVLMTVLGGQVVYSSNSH